MYGIFTYIYHKKSTKCRSIYQPHGLYCFALLLSTQKHVLLEASGVGRSTIHLRIAGLVFWEFKWFLMWLWWLWWWWWLLLLLLLLFFFSELLGNSDFSKSKREIQPLCLLTGKSPPLDQNFKEQWAIYVFLIRFQYLSLRNQQTYSAGNRMHFHIAMLDFRRFN